MQSELGTQGQFSVWPWPLPSWYIAMILQCLRYRKGPLPVLANIWRCEFFWNEGSYWTATGVSLSSTMSWNELLQWPVARLHSIREHVQWTWCCCKGNLVRKHGVLLWNLHLKEDPCSEWIEMRTSSLGFGLDIHICRGAQDQGAPHPSRSKYNTCWFQ